MAKHPLHTLLQNLSAHTSPQIMKLVLVEMLWQQAAAQQPAAEEMPLHLEAPALFKLDFMEPVLVDKLRRLVGVPQREQEAMPYPLEEMA